MPFWGRPSPRGRGAAATPALPRWRRDPIGLRRAPAAGWALEGGGLRVFHAGDTAHGALVDRIGADLGPCDLAIVPIGAGAPRGPMGTRRARRVDAMRIAASVGAPRALGIRWGSFGRGAGSPARDVGRFRAAARPGMPVPLVAEIGQTLPIAPDDCS